MASLFTKHPFFYGTPGCLIYLRWCRECLPWNGICEVSHFIVQHVLDRTSLFTFWKQPVFSAWDYSVGCSYIPKPISLPWIDFGKYRGCHLRHILRHGGVSLLMPPDNSNSGFRKTLIPRHGTQGKSKSTQPDTELSPVSASFFVHVHWILPKKQANGNNSFWTYKSFYVSWKRKRANCKNTLKSQAKNDTLETSRKICWRSKTREQCSCITS